MGSHIHHPSSFMMKRNIQLGRGVYWNLIVMILTWSLPSPLEAVNNAAVNEVGCYTNDTEATIFLHLTIYLPTLKLQNCILSCIDEQKKYAAVSNRENCLCGSVANLDYLMPYEVSDAECNLYCSLNPLQRCGGPRRVSVYRAECSPGWYGLKPNPTCRVRCGECRKTSEDGQSICNMETGHCDSTGCKPGWFGLKCKEECPAGYFGEDCAKKCFCVEGETCDHITGKCNTTCAPGYMEDSNGGCSLPCTDGFHGRNCTHRCHCAEDEPCDSETGSCPLKCAEGWMGPDCMTGCGKGRFGQDCEHQCHCAGTSSAMDVCDTETGLCESGKCQPGWKGENCSQACDDRYWGENCQFQCLCKGEEACNKENGLCPNGCIPGRVGRGCRRECQEGKFGDGCSGECHCHLGYACDPATGVCPDKKCAEGYYGESCHIRWDGFGPSPYAPVVIPHRTVYPGYTLPAVTSPQEKPSTGLALGDSNLIFIMVGLLGLIVVIMSIMCVVVVCRRRHKSRDRTEIESLSSSTRRFIRDETGELIHRQDSCAGSVNGRTRSWVSQQTAETESNLYAEIPEMGNLSTGSGYMPHTPRDFDRGHPRSLPGYSTPDVVSDRRPPLPTSPGFQSLPRDYQRSVSQPLQPQPASPETDYMQPRPSPMPGHGDGPGPGFAFRGRPGPRATLPRLHEPTGYGSEPPPSKIIEEPEHEGYSPLASPSSPGPAPPVHPRNRSTSAPGIPGKMVVNGMEHIYLDMNKSREQLNDHV